MTKKSELEKKVVEKIESYGVEVEPCEFCGEKYEDCDCGPDSDEFPNN